MLPASGLGMPLIEGPLSVAAVNDQTVGHLRNEADCTQPV